MPTLAAAHIFQQLPVSYKIMMFIGKVVLYRFLNICSFSRNWSILFSLLQPLTTYPTMLLSFRHIFITFFNSGRWWIEYSIFKYFQRNFTCFWDDRFPFQAKLTFTSNFIVILFIFLPLLRIVQLLQETPPFASAC